MLIKILLIVAISTATLATVPNRYQTTFKNEPGHPVASYSDEDGQFCGLEAVICEDEDLEAIFKKEEKEHGLDAGILSRLAYCESRLDPNAIGDTNLPRPSYGLFQISLYFHPDITEAQALSRTGQVIGRPR